MQRWHLVRTCSDILEMSPSLYATVQRFHNKEGVEGTKRVVRPHTDIVIEGFPRSANTFVWHAYKIMYDPGGNHHVAIHYHSPAQVHLGIRWGVPSIVLIRDAEEAVISCAARMVEKKRLDEAQYKGFFEQLNLDKYIAYWTQRYTAFYRSLMSVRRSIIVGEFYRVTRDVASFLQQAMKHAGRNISVLDDGRKLDQLVKGKSQPHVFPSQHRERIKDDVKEYFYSAKNEPNRVAAKLAYEEFLFKR